MKGYILDTVEQYETKQDEIADLMNLGYKTKEDIDGNPIQGEKVRYAGRIKNGVTYPDILLNSGKFFIPYNAGPDEISMSDIDTGE